MAWTLEDFDKVLRADLSRYGGRQGIEGPDATDQSEGGERTWRYRIYTDTNRYSISASDRGGIATFGYLGCIALARKPRAGEDWQRGNDLADGPLTPETWHKILADVVSYEMVKVHSKAKAMADAAMERAPTELFAQEIETYQAHLSGLVRQGLVGRYAIADTYEEALAVGYRYFGKQPFMVKAIDLVDRPIACNVRGRGEMPIAEAVTPGDAEHNNPAGSQTYNAAATENISYGAAQTAAAPQPAGAPQRLEVRIRDGFADPTSP
jgi:hypothetical protein